MRSRTSEPSKAGRGWEQWVNLMTGLACTAIAPARCIPLEPPLSQKHTLRVPLTEEGNWSRGEQNNLFLLSPPLLPCISFSTLSSFSQVLLCMYYALFLYTPRIWQWTKMVRAHPSQSHLRDRTRVKALPKVETDADHVPASPLFRLMPAEQWWREPDADHAPASPLFPLMPAEQRWRDHDCV